MENWVGVKSCLPQYFPPFLFLYFFIGFGLVKKVAKSQMALRLSWEIHSSFFFGQEGLVSVHFFSGIYTS